MFNDRLFGEVRSAIHAGKYKRLERLIQRQLPDEVEHYIISQLDRATRHNAWNMAEGLSGFDAPTVLEAMSMSVEAHRLSKLDDWRKRFEHAVSMTTDGWKTHRDNRAHHIAPVDVYKVLLLKQADGTVFYRRIIAVVASCLALEEHSMALLGQTHAQADGFKRRRDWLDNIAQSDRESAPLGAFMRRQLGLAYGVNDALHHATLHGLHDALYWHFVRHTNEQYHRSENPWDSLKAVMLNAQLESAL